MIQCERKDVLQSAAFTDPAGTLSSVMNSQPLILRQRAPLFVHLTDQSLAQQKVVKQYNVFKQSSRKTRKTLQNTAIS